MVVVVLLPLNCHPYFGGMLARPALDVVHKLPHMPQRLFTGTRLKHKPYVYVIRHHNE